MPADQDFVDIDFKDLDADSQKLVKMSVSARDFAYCPYSKFQVGAALLTDKGTYYSGSNVENAAYGDSICAERTALVKAISSGEKDFKAIAVSAQPVSGNVTSPCGSCRQFIIEFSRDRDIIVYLAEPVSMPDKPCWKNRVEVKAQNTATDKLSLNICSLRRWTHAIVYFYTTSWMAYGGLLMWMHFTEIDPYPFFRHGYEYKAYFFSLWLTALQSIYFTLHFTIDVLEQHNDNKFLLKVSKVLHSVANYLLFSLVFPLTILVFILFWSAYFWNRELIYPVLMDIYVPKWLNHAMHTFPVPITILYILISNQKEPSKTATLSGLLAFLGFYTSLFYAIRWRDGKWIYTFFEPFPSEVVHLIFATSSLMATFFLLMGHKIHELKRNVKALQD